jgi:hypothetical protein
MFLFCHDEHNCWLENGDDGMDADKEQVRHTTALQGTGPPTDAHVYSKQT